MNNLEDSIVINDHPNYHMNKNLDIGNYRYYSINYC